MKSFMRGAVYEKFAAEVAARDAAYQAAREWIDAKGR
jgi:hypothetical protein